jgi:hypothetical protein
MLAALAIAGSALVAPPVARSAAPVDRLWFTPDAGTNDFIRLFQQPAEWARARQIVSVFEFYQQHTQTPPPSIVGPNTYDALARANVFRTLTSWGKKIAIEGGAVKEFYCTPDASGMNASIAATMDSIRAVQAAGGTVSYFAMDEPFVAGRAAVCGGPALEPTADRVAQYTKSVRASFPNLQLGLIEAYPFSDEPALETILDLLRARGVLPAFLHVDVDLNAVRPDRNDLPRDLQRLRDRCAALGMQSGVLIWGNNGDADVLYSLDAGRLLNALTTAFPTWNDLPDHVIVQSFAVSRTGLLITPTNLPETELYTHTHILLDFYRRLRGMTGPSTGTAVSRR